MPLSEEELRLLEQMERALVEEDPKFANTLRGTAFRRSARRRAIVAGVVFVAGVAILMSGAITSTTVLGVVGFVIMLGSAYVAVTSIRGHVRSSQQEGQQGQQGEGDVTGLSLIDGGRSSKPKVPRRKRRPSTSHPSFGRSGSQGSFMERMEERWRRRKEGGGF